MIRTLAVALLLYGIPQMASAQGTASRGCAEQIAQAKAWAGSLRVSVDRTKADVASSFKISWKASSTNPPVLFSGPAISQAYLVFTVGHDVRLATDGAIALTPEAKAPHDIRFGKAETRAFVPISGSDANAKGGELSVTPMRKERLPVSWAVIVGGTCGEQVFNQGQQWVDVSNGAPELVIQDQYSPTSARRIHSLNGAYEMLVSKDRYEVQDVATGTRIIEIAGLDPNFSPTSRFVISRRGTDDLLEVFDLLSRKRIAELPSGLVAWMRNDSYFISAADDWGNVSIHSAIVDGEPVLSANTACHACSAWNDGQVVADFDRGFFAIFGDSLNGESVVTNIASRKKFGSSSDGHQNRVMAFMRTRYQAPQMALPKTWDLGERLALSTVSDPKTQSRFLVQHRSADSKRAEISGTSAPLLVGRSLLRDLSDPAAAERPQRHFPKEQLDSLGLPTFPDETVEQLFHSSETSRSTDSRLLALIKDIAAKVPDAAPLFKENWDTCSERNLSPTNISDIWRWKSQTDEFWLVQAICSEGSIGAHYSHEYLIQSGSTRKVTRLDLPIGGASRNASFYDSLRLKPFNLSLGILGVALIEAQKIALIDIRTGKLLAPLIETKKLELLSTMRLLQGSKHLLQLGKDGLLTIFDINRSNRVLTGAVVDDEVVISDDTGKYDTTYEGASFVQVRFPGSPGLYNFRQFEKLLFEPHLAASVLTKPRQTSQRINLAVPPIARLVVSSAAKDGIRSGRISVTGESELSEARIYVDGRLDQTFPIKGKTANIDVKVPDPGGGRWISAVATDANGLVSLPSAIKLPGKAAAAGSLRAVTIGVDAYTDPGIVTLQSAKSDAVNLGKAFTLLQGRVFSSVAITPLLDDHAVPDAILSAVREAANATKPGDTLIITFAGHALGEPLANGSQSELMLATNVSRLDNLADTSVKWSELFKAVHPAQGKVIFILDACHAGLAGSEKFGTNDDVMSSLATQSGATLVVLAASKGRQMSLENAAAGGGLFTSAIVDAIGKNRPLLDTDRNGLLDAGELYRGVKNAVVEKSNGEQTPWMARSGIEGNLSLF